MFSLRKLSFFEKLLNEIKLCFGFFKRKNRLKKFIHESVNLDVFTVDYTNQGKKIYRTDSMAITLKYFGKLNILVKQ